MWPGLLQDGRATFPVHLLQAKGFLVVPAALP